MSDLISKKEVLKAIKTYFHKMIDNGNNAIDTVECAVDLQVVISEMETAYNVDKVLDMLDEAYNNSTLGDYHKIVKNGGINE